jgi:cation-transporting P-type ATPase 13A2
VYYIFAGCLIFLSIVALIIALYETISNLKAIQKQAHYSCPIKVLRGDKGNRGFTEIDSSELVPGDIV